jgi:hypothetical protein
VIPATLRLRTSVLNEENIAALDDPA